MVEHTEAASNGHSKSSTATKMPVKGGLKENIGVYTDPAHNLYVKPASPSVAEIESGEALKEGEVLIEMKATGICGYVWI